jgi:uncharacterized protein YqgV (UPF0045/DUF77 family)
MPGYNRAPLSAELTVPDEQLEAARQAAGATGLARESGPGRTLLAGRRDEVLDAAMKVIEASLEAGAHVVEVRVEATGDAERIH